METVCKQMSLNSLKKKVTKKLFTYKSHTHTHTHTHTHIYILDEHRKLYSVKPNNLYIYIYIS